jgi:hypothetical protein
MMATATYSQFNNALATQIILTQDGLVACHLGILIMAEIPITTAVLSESIGIVNW